MADPITLYKLIILYLLRHVRYPLTHAQLSDFLLGKEYCTYFVMQQAVQELLESHLMKDETVRNYTRYELTREGEDALTFFVKDIPEEIRKDMDDFLRENRIRLRDELGIVSTYQETNDGDYLVTCEIREGGGVLMKLELTVPTSQQAEIMCEKWREVNQPLYAYTMKELLRD